MEITNYGLKFDKLDYNLSVKLFELAFEHYDLFTNVKYFHNKSEEYEERRENLLRDLSDFKPAEVKMHLISLIDSIDKLYNTEERYIEDTLQKMFSMSDLQINFYKQLLHQNNEKIQRYKFNLLGKVIKNRILDFSYNFNIIYAEKNNEKVEFAIKILIKFINDQGKEDKLDIDLTINQFYSLFNEFQKIESMIKTLVN